MNNSGDTAIPASSTTSSSSTQDADISDNEPSFYCIYCAQKKVRLQGR
jgi:hypothetical protein